jgi:hypothetical protein
VEDNDDAGGKESGGNVPDDKIAIGWHESVELLELTKIARRA